jgi:intron-binding protein aquarius
MPKVYGTGVYDFRRHRVAEYPIDQPVPAPAPAPPPPDLPSDKPPPIASLAQPITLLEIQRDRLTRIAASNWGPSASERDFKPQLVKEIYETELMVTGRGRKTVPLHRVMILEVSQYLENYLWPNFDPDSASFQHVMSMILMVNEKFRENVAAWVCFHDRKDAFKAFLSRVLQLKQEVPFLFPFFFPLSHLNISSHLFTLHSTSLSSIYISSSSLQQRTLTMAEKTNYLLFMINAFQSLEDEIVSETVLQLVGLRLWHSLSPGRFQVLI